MPTGLEPHFDIASPPSLPSQVDLCCPGSKYPADMGSRSSRATKLHCPHCRRWHPVGGDEYQRHRVHAVDGSGNVVASGTTPAKSARRADTTRARRLHPVDALPASRFLGFGSLLPRRVCNASCAPAVRRATSLSVSCLIDLGRLAFTCRLVRRSFGSLGSIRRRLSPADLDRQASPNGPSL